jgi:hypothetical protein
MDFLLGFILGLGLAAAAGFRIFVPLLLVSIAAFTGHLELSDSFAWVGTPTALVMFAVATFLEIVAFFIPWLDNLLDSLAVPASVICGTLLMALALMDVDPLLKWSVAIIAGGGTAGIIQGATAGLRLGSTAVTGGTANPLISGAETAGAFVLGLLALLVPLLAGALAVLIIYIVVRKVRRRMTRN